MEIGTGKKKMGLSTQIFIALLAGAICGVCVHYFLKEGYFRDTILVGGVFYVLGQGFIRLMHWSFHWCCVRWCVEACPSVIQRRWGRSAAKRSCFICARRRLPL